MVKVKKTKEIHHGWAEWQKMPKEFKDKLSFQKSVFGKWHYIYESKKGTVSLIRIIIPVFSLYPLKQRYRYVWETCGTLEHQRFKTLKTAEAEIYKALK